MATVDSMIPLLLQRPLLFTSYYWHRPSFVCFHFPFFWLMPNSCEKDQNWVFSGLPISTTCCIPNWLLLVFRDSCLYCKKKAWSWEPFHFFVFTSNFVSNYIKTSLLLLQLNSSYHERGMNCLKLCHVPRSSRSVLKIHAFSFSPCPVQFTFPHGSSA